MRRVALALTAAMMVAFAVSAAAAQAAPIALNVWGTSDVTDSNLFSQVILPGFDKAYPAYTITYHAVGTGAAIKEAEVASNGVDALIVHSPLLEAGFVSGGYSLEPFGRSIFYNDYVIIGPKTDPAGVAAADPNNAVGAFQTIAASGATGKATFLSRNDASGTNTEEETIWGQTTTVTKQLAANRPAGNTTLYQPEGSGGVGTYPAWYEFTNTTQGANVIDTNTCAAPAPPNSCYTITDRGTFYAEQKAGNAGNLKIVTQNNSAGAVGGAGELTNPFHAYVVKTAPNQAGAIDLLNYLVSSNAQAQFNGFPTGTPAFHSDAYGQITASTLPTHAAAGSKITIAATLVYPPPVAQPIVTMPVTLQSSPTGNAGTWTNVATVNTDSTGTATFTNVTINATTHYQISMGTYDDSLLATQFSPNTNTDLGPNGNGIVTVP